MAESSPTLTPMIDTPKLVATRGSPFVDVHLYRSILGTQQYICITRLDIAFCVNKLSQFMNNPYNTHWKAIKRVLRYLQGTLQHGLFFIRGHIELSGYFDVDWALIVEDKRSTLGYCIYLGLNLVA